MCKESCTRSQRRNREASTKDIVIVKVILTHNLNIRGKKKNKYVGRGVCASKHMHDGVMR